MMIGGPAGAGGFGWFLLIAVLERMIVFPSPSLPPAFNVPAATGRSVCLARLC